MMARRALLVGINDYQSISDLNGCLNDVSNVRDILKTYLGFTNNDIRVVQDSRATREGILYRLEYMVKVAQPGDFMVFHFSGHGSQIRDRGKQDELLDGMDELLCPWDHDWEKNFILDDDLDLLFSKLPEGSLLEVILDCCHSGNGTRTAGPEPGCARIPRYLPPPPDVRYRHEGEDGDLPRRGFTAGNRSGNRSTARHVLWSACRSDQQASDAVIGGSPNGAFSYYFCKHMRETGGDITRRNLLERIRNSLRHNGYAQVPQLECMNDATYENRPFQMPAEGEEQRTLFLMTPYMRGNDVRNVQLALRNAGISVSVDGVFGPGTQKAVKAFQDKNHLPADGVVGPNIRALLFR
jgi:hypothetical protein